MYQRAGGCVCTPLENEPGRARICQDAPMKKCRKGSDAAALATGDEGGRGRQETGEKGALWPERLEGEDSGALECRESRARGCILRNFSTLAH